jgi:hypothetical protein
VAEVVPSLMEEMGKAQLDCHQGVQYTAMVMTRFLSGRL